MFAIAVGEKLKHRKPIISAITVRLIGDVKILERCATHLLEENGIAPLISEYWVIRVCVKRYYWNQNGSFQPDKIF